MDATFSLQDSLAAADLKVYLERAARVEDGAVRLVAGGGVLAVYTAIVYPRGLLDTSPTVLGLRTFRVGPAAEFDAVVPSRSLRERVDRGIQAAVVESDEVPLGVPLEVASATWAGISPPRGGWREVDAVEPAVLGQAARAGMAEVAGAVPEGTGEQLVQKVRAEVWSAPIDDLDYVPAGAAFAAESLGFLADEPVTVHETGPWTRLSTSRGHVLVRRQAWSLAG